MTNTEIVLFREEMVKALNSNNTLPIEVKRLVVFELLDALTKSSVSACEQELAEMNKNIDTESEDK